MGSLGSPIPYLHMTAASYILFAVFGMAISCIIVGYLSDRLSNRKSPMFVFGGVCLGGLIGYAFLVSAKETKGRNI